MISKKVTIVNAMGFANAMTKYPCDVTICSNGVKTDGKSIMNIIAACIKCGMEIEVICNGEREDEALNEAVTMIESGFGE